VQGIFPRSSRLSRRSFHFPFQFVGVVRFDVLLHPEQGEELERVVKRIVLLKLKPCDKLRANEHPHPQLKLAELRYVELPVFG